MFKEFEKFSIKRMTIGGVPDVSFFILKEKILGKKYSLSLVFPNYKFSEDLNHRFKKKAGPVNILSFPLSQDSGEIFIHLETTRRQARLYNRSYLQHLAFLFIHGCLHLAGHQHGEKMEKMEKKILNSLNP